MRRRNMFVRRSTHADEWVTLAPYVDFRSPTELANAWEVEMPWWHNQDQDIKWIKRVTGDNDGTNS